MIEVRGATVARDTLASAPHEADGAFEADAASGRGAVSDRRSSADGTDAHAYAAEAARPVLSDVTLSVSPGELVALVGENGAGKSTLANLICGSLVAQPGMVAVDGIDPAASDDARMQVRRTVGHVFQQPEDQIVSTAVFDEVAFGPRNMGWDEAAVEHAVISALSIVGLAGFEDREVAALSGGEQQRLALASVLSCAPAYVVLDEVTSQLDSATRPAFRSLFRSLAHEQGHGVVQVTHDPLEVLMSDRVLVMEGGRLVWEGSPSRLVRERRQLWDATLPPSTYASALCTAVERGYDMRLGVEPGDLVAWLYAGPEGADKECSGDPTRASVRAAVAHILEEAGGAGALASSCEMREHAHAEGIEAHRVSFAYEDPRGRTLAREVLHAVDLSVAPGSITLVAAVRDRVSQRCFRSWRALRSRGRASLPWAGSRLPGRRCGGVPEP